MSDNEALEMYEEMKRIYGDALPHPDNHPILFAYYVKMYKYYHQVSTI
jgi:hypothetical protein